MNKLSEILTGPETWCQHISTSGPRHCLLGAVMRLTDGRSAYEREREYDRLRQICGKETGEWNDAPERTWDEVAAVVSAYDTDRLLNP